MNTAHLLEQPTHGYRGIFDSHAHYDDDYFAPHNPEVLAQLPQNGVCGVINIGCTLASSAESLRMAEQYPWVYAAVGIHPHDAPSCTEDALTQLAQMAAHPKAVAIGEIGLDYHYEGISKEGQKKAFRDQLELARKLDLPVIIHSRDATKDTMEILEEYRPKGVVHCYSGSAETAKEILRLGMYLGFTGVLTFPNAKHAVASVEAAPLDRLLLETDCPYMAPVPYRGKICRSDMIWATAEAMAKCKGVEPQAMIDLARQNTCRLFSIPDPMEGDKS